jgi:hypothetical protein
MHISWIYCSPLYNYFSTQSPMRYTQFRQRSRSFFKSLMTELWMSMAASQLNHRPDFIVRRILISSKCYFSLGKRWKPDGAKSGLMVSDPRRRNQGFESLQLFSHLCIFQRCHVEGEAAPCKDQFFAVVFRSPSVSQCRSELMAFRSVVCHSGSAGPVQAFHHDQA